VQDIGVDLAKRSFPVCFLAEDDTTELATYLMTPDGLAAFRERLSPEDRLAVEVGTNAYYFHDQVADAVAEITLVSPYQFAVIVKSKKKTDRGDAMLLARFLKLDYLPRVVMPAPRIRELRQLFTAPGGAREYEPRVQEHGARRAGSQWDCGHARRFRKWRRPAVASAPRGARPGRSPGAGYGAPATGHARSGDGRTRTVHHSHRSPAAGPQAVAPGPGTGPRRRHRGALRDRRHHPDITRFPTAKQLTAYAGLVTSGRQSGATDHHGHITKQGRKRLRGFMVEAVLSMIRQPAEGANSIVDFYQRNKREKGAGKAICAAARKLLTGIHVILSKGLDYWFLEERLYQTKLKQLAAA
jgi:transposase